MGRMRTRALVGAAFLGGLAGCGDVERLSYSDLDAISKDLTTRYEEMDATEGDVVPGLDTATFTGVAKFAPGAGGGGGSESGQISGISREIFAGEITMTADFRRQSFSGEITNFRNIYDGAPYYSGKFDISGGSIETSTFEADLTGNIESSRGIYTYRGKMEGDILGPRGNALLGTIEGEATETRTGGLSDLNGTFVVAQ
jgi:hypothetical protein